MSEQDNDFNLFDPTGVMKTMRDAGLNAWAKMMLETVNSEAYAQAQGQMLDAWLSSSAPFRKAMESAMTQSLANLNLPSRDDITRLAERLTNIEMKLDDLDARVDEIHAAVKKGSAKKKATEADK